MSAMYVSWLNVWIAGDTLKVATQSLNIKMDVLCFSRNLDSQQSASCADTQERLDAIFDVFFLLLCI